MSRWSMVCALSLSWGMLAVWHESARAAEDSVERIEAALAAPTELEFVETPITEICAFLAESHKINVFLDRKELEVAGMTGDHPVTVNLHDVSLEAALRLALPQAELGFVIRDESLVITSKDVANAARETKVYPVGDLLGDTLNGFRTEPAALVKLLTRSIEPETWIEMGGTGDLSVAAKARSIVCVHNRRVHRQIERMLDELRAAREVQEEDDEEDSEDDAEVVLRVYRLPGAANGGQAGVAVTPLEAETTLQLAKALQSTIEPESWSEVGGPGSISAAGNALFVRQTPAVHARVRAALLVFSPQAGTAVLASPAE